MSTLSTPQPTPPIPLAPKSLTLPEPTKIGQRQAHAQERFAAHTLRARWLGGFDAATPAHRAVVLSQSQQLQDAMFALNAVPTAGHGAIPPASFVDAAQLRLRLPLPLQAAPHASVAAPWTPLVTMSYSEQAPLRLRR